MGVSEAEVLMGTEPGVFRMIRSSPLTSEIVKLRSQILANDTCQSEKYRL